MPVPDRFRGRLSLPAIAAPMFLVSGTALVAACCRAGIAAAFPALNARSADEFERWLAEIARELPPQAAPFGVNLILHASNLRRDGDLDLIVRHRVPFVITSLGDPRAVVDAVHAYGGLVFSDVIHARHARKAIEAGADGHAGAQSPFALVREIRAFWDGPLALGGAIGDGAGIRAAEILGADLAYIGTRFIATRESLAADAYKRLLVEAGAADVVYTDSVTGTHANLLRATLPAAQAAAAGQGRDGEPRAWRDVWSAGHGVSLIHDIPSVAELVGRLADEYRRALAVPGAAAPASRAPVPASPEALA